MVYCVKRRPEVVMPLVVAEKGGACGGKEESEDGGVEGNRTCGEERRLVGEV